MAAPNDSAAINFRVRMFIVLSLVEVAVVSQGGLRPHLLATKQPRPATRPQGKCDEQHTNARIGESPTGCLTFLSGIGTGGRGRSIALRYGFRRRPSPRLPIPALWSFSASNEGTPGH